MWYTFTFIDSQIDNCRCPHDAHAPVLREEAERRDVRHHLQSTVHYGSYWFLKTQSTVLIDSRLDTVDIGYGGIDWVFTLTIIRLIESHHSFIEYPRAETYLKFSSFPKSTQFQVLEGRSTIDLGAECKKKDLGMVNAPYGNFCLQLWWVIHPLSRQLVGMSEYRVRISETVWIESLQAVINTVNSEFADWKDEFFNLTFEVGVQISIITPFQLPHQNGDRPSGDAREQW